MTPNYAEQPNQPPQSPADYEKNTTNYVLGEVCIVVEADHLQQEFAPSLYQAVRKTVNDWLSRNLPLARTDGLADPFDQDMAPRELKREFGEKATILYDLPPDRLGKDLPNPWVILAQRRGAPKPPPPRALCFYSIGDSRGPKPPPGSDEFERQKALVRELVCYLNYGFLGLGTAKPPLGLEGITGTILATSPNWLTAALAVGGSCNGPGGLPRAADDYPPRRRLFEFAMVGPLTRYDREAADKERTRIAGGRIKPSNVVVAILDSSPTWDDLAAAADRYRDNWLLRDLRSFFSDPTTPEPVDRPYGRFEGLSDYLTNLGPYRLNWNGAQLDPAHPDDHFLMADHGLFIAGIIHHLAPDVTVHLIRTNSDYGTGDVTAIASVIAALPGRLLTKAEQRLVINLSQGAEVPYFDLFLWRWFQNTYKDLRAAAGGIDRWQYDSFLQQVRSTSKATALRVTSLVDLARKNVEVLFEWLAGPDDPNVLLVAATGNDAFLPPASPKEPRYPAAYDFVLGVAAFKLDGNRADYSNDPDEQGPSAVPNGVVAFGGNADPPRGFLSGPPVIGDVSDAVRGVFTATVLPISQEANETGWVYWVGTSFATPIISALAANYWADPRGGLGKRARRIMSDLMSLVGTTPPGHRGNWVQPT